MTSQQHSTTAPQQHNTTNGNVWPRVYWNTSDLQYVSEVLQIINPSGFKNAESLGSYIVSVAEKELYRQQTAIDISTGGWTVCFFPAWKHKADEFDFCAVVSLTGYTVHRYVVENKR